MTAEDDAPRPACPVCHRPDPAGQSWAVCPMCVARVDRWLVQLLELHTLSRQPAALFPAQTGDPGPIGAHRDPPLPLNLAALDLAVGEVLLMMDEDVDEPPWMGLETWERDWRHWFGLTAYGNASESRQTGARSHDSATEVTLVGVVAFLRAQWPLAAQKHPAADEFYTDIRRMVTYAEVSLGLAEERPWSVACPTDGCGARLKVTYEGRSALLRCRKCRVERTLANLIYVSRAAGKPCWLDAEAAARFLHVDVPRLGPLVRDGRLRARGDRDCRQYDINSVRHADAAG